VVERRARFDESLRTFTFWRLAARRPISAASPRAAASNIPAKRAASAEVGET
jgi:hypothetical protein